MPVKEAIQAINMVPANLSYSLPSLKLNNFQQMLSRSEQIKQNCSRLIFNRHSENDARYYRTILNKAVSVMRKRRIKLHHQYEEPYKDVTRQLNQITDNLSDAKRYISKQINEMTQQKKKRIANSLKSDLHKICQSRHIKDIPVPKNALRTSISQTKRLKIISNQVDLVAADAKRQRLQYTDGHLVDPKTGEIIPTKRQKLVFNDSPQKYHLLMNFIKENHIHVETIK